MFGSADDRERVSHVEFADEIQVKLEAGNLKLGCRRTVTDIERIHRVISAEAEAFERAIGDVEQGRKIQIIGGPQQQTVARYQANEMRERLLDRIEILKNVRMIELQVIDQANLGKVMNELAAFVEEGRVVFVAFDDEPFAVGETRPLA